MARQWSYLFCSFVVVAQAAQPSSPSPPQAPVRELPWGQLNFLHTTDTHGWHAGHLQEPSYTGDWGDYISFAARLREKADADGSDLLLIDTGDRIEGNGLYDGDDPKGNHTRAIFKHQSIDVITIGNHELYKSNSSRNDFDEMVPNYRGNYIATNLDYIRQGTEEQVPFAQRYKKFTTKNQGIRILAFGFLFNFKGNSNNTIVQPVEETVKEQWFQDAIRDKDVDLILVAGHVAIRSPEYTAVYGAIRSVQWDTPIQFFGGHTHIRDYKKYDSKSYALESGRYMETVGFQSISGLSTSKGAQAHASPTFARRYIDNNLHSYYHHTGLNASTFHTPLGQNVTEQIHSARKSLNLDHTFGCAPRDLWTNRVPYPDPASIFTWLDSQVVPDQVVDAERGLRPRIIIGNTGAVRFDMFKGPFTKDTKYIVLPFTNGFRYIKDVPYALADRLLSVLNNDGPIFEQAGLQSHQLVTPEQLGIAADIVADNDHAARLQDFSAMEGQVPLGGKKEEKKLTPGYTTKDDAGDDGDDTLHSKISFYRVPNCFETRVNTTSTIYATGEERPADTVDVVYLEFIEPWVLLALQFLGGAYKAKDTAPYAGEKDFTSMISDWVADNWSENC